LRLIRRLIEVLGFVEALRPSVSTLEALVCAFAVVVACLGVEGVGGAALGHDVVLGVHGNVLAPGHHVGAGLGGRVHRLLPRQLREQTLHAPALLRGAVLMAVWAQFLQGKGFVAGRLAACFVTRGRMHVRVHELMRNVVSLFRSGSFSFFSHF